MDILYEIFDQADEEGSNLLAVSLKSFRQVNKDAKIIIYTPSMGVWMFHYLMHSIPDLKIIYFDKDEWFNRRMLCKIEKLQKIVGEYNDGTRILMADYDTYFCKNPFDAPLGDSVMAFCERTNFLRFPVNGGIVYFKVCKEIKNFIKFWLKQAFVIDWFTLLDVATSRKWPDWFFDQDMLCALYKDPQWIYDRFGFRPLILGPEYNYFPEVDAEPNWMEMMKNAYLSKINTTLHFKGEDLKTLYKKDWFVDYVNI